jgi:hypothetical protein
MEFQVYRKNITEGQDELAMVSAWRQDFGVGATE